VKLPVEGLTRFQAKAVAIIAGVRSEDEAAELAMTYRANNPRPEMCSEKYGGRWGLALKAQYDANPKAFPCIARVSESGAVKLRKAAGGATFAKPTSDYIDELCRRARAALDAEDEIAAAVEYEISEIVPIPAKCPRCKRNFLDADAIRAASLDNACCFYWALIYLTHQLSPRPNQLHREAQCLRQTLNRFDRQAALSVHERGERRGVYPGLGGDRDLCPPVSCDGLP
jgi:hypothetical protein